ncbi:MAG: hypothetical protein GQ477_04675 [Nanohaloarchaea archaeon]|nr:hypothetical protein [Candidatus Nanohaloarchaea archaeon]
MAIFSVASQVLADDNDILLIIGTDSTNYMAGDNITIYGWGYNGSNIFESLTISLVDPEGITVAETTDFNINTETNMFISILKAPYVAGTYDVMVNIFDKVAIKQISITVPITVIEIAEMKAELVEDSFTVSSFGTPEDSSIIVDPIMLDTKATIYTIDTKDYYMILENMTGVYDRLYIDDDSDFTGSDDDSYLIEGSAVKIADQKYSIWYIDPKGNFVIFAKRIRHVFEPPYTQSDLLVLALDSDYNSLSDQEITMDVFDAEGNIELSDVQVGTTDQFGILDTTIELSDVPGTHSIVFNDGLATESYRIEIFGLKVSVVDAEENPAFKVSNGDTIFMRASVFGQGDALIVDGIQKSEAKISGHKTLEKFMLTPDADGIFTESYTIPMDVKGKFSVQFKFMYQDTQEVRKIRFEVEDHDLTLYPISSDFSQISSFAPGQESAMIISGKGTKDKKRIRLDAMTDGCNISMFDFDAIYDKDGVDVSGGEYRVMTISDYMSENGISNTIRNRLKKDYGDKSCVITFNTPENGGIYRLVTSVTLDDEMRTATASFEVDDIYLGIEQIALSGVDKTVLPGERVYFTVTATDAVTGIEIPAGKIISATIQQATVHDTRDIVTEDMVSLEIDRTYSADTALVSFIANDSMTGYHSVEFMIKVNVTRDGIEKTVDTKAYGMFREQRYAVKVSLEEQDRIYAGTDDDVAMIVEVMGVSDLAGESLEVEVDKILNKKTGKKINSDANCIIENTTNCMLIIESPKSGWSDGGYSVLLEIDDLDDLEGMDDADEHAYGWFN